MIPAGENYDNILYSENKSQTEISVILPNLFIGKIDAIYDKYIVKCLNIDIAVNCTQKKFENKEFEKMINIPLNDVPFSDDEIYLKKFYLQFICDIDSYLKNGKNVLLFCDEGKQQSPTICAIYLMCKYKIPLEKSIEFIKLKRIESFFGNINYFNILTDIELELKNLGHFENN